MSEETRAVDEAVRDEVLDHLGRLRFAERKVIDLEGKLVDTAYTAKQHSENLRRINEILEALDFVDLSHAEKRGVLKLIKHLSSNHHRQYFADGLPF